MQDVRNAILNAAGGSDRSARVRLGADYPQRTFSENLAVSSGSLQTDDPGSGITVSNVTPVDDETADYFNASSPTIGPLETRTLSYRPTYTRYTAAPVTVYENSVAYNRFGGGRNLTLTEQSVVDGRRITLVALNGSLAEASDRSVTVDAAALSAAEPIAVRDAGGDPITLTIPTRLPASAWAELLDDQLDGPGTDERYVQSVTQAGPGQVAITLEPGVTYDLRLASVGVGADTTDPPAHYATDVAGDDASVAEGGTRKLVVEVRDRFNNPVSNRTVAADVDVSAGTGDFVSPATAVTDEDGRASFVYHAPGNVDDAQQATVTAYFGAKTPGRQNVTFDVEVLDADGSGGGACGDDPGTGGEEQWCAAAPSTTVSQPGGVISNVGTVSSIELSNPSFSSIRPDDGQVRAASERFRLAFVVEQEGDTTGTTRYLFVIPDTELGMIQDLDNTGTTVQNRGVVIYRDQAHNTDGVGWEPYVSESIQQTHLNNWYDNTETIDLLDGSIYTGNVQTELDAIQSFMANNDVRVYVIDMDGRVELTID